MLAFVTISMYRYFMWKGIACDHKYQMKTKPYVDSFKIMF